MTVIAIGLDSAEPELFERWLKEGHLPTFQALIDQGAYGRLDNFDIFTAELPWTTFATGVMPAETGYWTPLKYHCDYTVNTRGAYEYEEYPAFFALDDCYEVCVFDIPQVRLQKNLNGWQFNAWGAHSPQVERESNVPEEFQKVMDKFGIHPGLHRDYSHALNMVNVKSVYDMLMEGTNLRGEVCEYLLKQRKWDLFLTVFGETHGAGHNFWQFEPEHPLFKSDIPGKALLPKSPLLEHFKEIDKSVKRIIDNSPEDADIVIFSAHGMGPNTMDLPSCFFLPEFMYRYCFNRPALAANLPLEEPITSQTWGSWERHVWNTINKGNFIIKLARQYLPGKLYRIVGRWLEFVSDEYPMSVLKAEKVYFDKPWNQPAFWYGNLWPKMAGFALPSFSEGYIRINLEGREEHGLVKSADYQKVVDDICRELERLVCARTGTKMVRKIVKTRQDAFDNNPKLPDADIVVAWQEEFATDAVEHPTFGRIGPVPHFRAGSHRHSGFAVVKSAKVAAGSDIVGGHALDVAPTLLTMLGAAIPQYMKGKPFQVKPHDCSKG
jgi:predicted AlkP superfamily phosphohydrolase/phosphomutase